jgi:DNA-binding transcriptional ArsR family regulator
MSNDAVLAALADSTRRELLGRLAGGPVPAGKLANGFPMSRPAVVKHLRVLREAGLVQTRKAGRQQYYELVPNGLDEIRAVLDDVTRLWSSALDAFQRYAEREE